MGHIVLTKIFSAFLLSGHEKQALEGLYRQIVRQARMPFFYRDYGVEDTLDGRFDVLCACVIAVIRGLHDDATQRPHSPKSARYQQFIFDQFFCQMDEDCRERGIGDLGVPKHIKKMMIAFHGRLDSYLPTLQKRDADALARALCRNLYRGKTDKNADAVARWMIDVADQSSIFFQTHKMQSDFIFPTPTLLQQKAA
jgi:cytochrome b pre-mRNA-processing protein 3